MKRDIDLQDRLEQEAVRSLKDKYVRLKNEKDNGETKLQAML